MKFNIRAILVILLSITGVSAEEPHEALSRITGEVIQSQGSPDQSQIDQQFNQWLMTTPLPTASAEQTNNGICIGFKCPPSTAGQNGFLPKVNNVTLHTRTDGDLNPDFLLTWGEPNSTVGFVLVEYEVYIVRNNNGYEYYRTESTQIKFRDKTSGQYSLYIRAIFNSTSGGGESASPWSKENRGDIPTPLNVGDLDDPGINPVVDTDLLACIQSQYANSFLLADLHDLDCTQMSIDNIEGLEHLSSLHVLNLSNTNSTGLNTNTVNDLSVLQGLIDLYHLDVSKITMLPGAQLINAAEVLIVRAQDIGLAAMPDLNDSNINHLLYADNNITQMDGSLLPAGLTHLELDGNPINNTSIQSASIAVESVTLRQTNITDADQASTTFKDNVKYLSLDESPLTGTQDFTSFTELCQLNINDTNLIALSDINGQTTLPAHLQTFYASNNSALTTIGNLGDYVGGQNYQQILLNGSSQIACPEIEHLQDAQANPNNPVCPDLTIGWTFTLAYSDCQPVLPLLYTNSTTALDGTVFQLSASAFTSDFALQTPELQQCDHDCANEANWSIANEQPADFFIAWTRDILRDPGEYQFRIKACSLGGQCKTSAPVNVNVIEDVQPIELEHIWINNSPSIRTFKLAWRLPLGSPGAVPPDYFRIRPGLTQAGNPVVGDVLHMDNVGNRIWHSDMITAGQFLGAVYSVSACVGSTSGNFCGDPVAINLQTSTPGHQLDTVSNVDYTWINQANNTFRVSLNYSSDYLCVGTQQATATRPDHFQIASAVNGNNVAQINIPSGQCSSSFTSATMTNIVPGSTYTVAACTANGDCSEASLITLLGAPTDISIPAPDWITSTINPSEQRQFELSWTEVADVDYYKVIEDGEQVDQVFITEDTSIQLQRYAGGDYSFTLMACKRDRDNGDTCGLEQTQSRTTFIDAPTQMMQDIINFDWEWIDQNEGVGRFVWGYFNVDCGPTLADERYRPDYFELGNRLVGGPELIDASNGDGNCIWNSSIIDIDNFLNQFTWEIRACTNSETCGNYSLFTIDPNSQPGALTENDQAAETHYWDAPPPAATRNSGPAELSPGLWHDPAYISTGWNFYFASHARYARVLEQYGDSYDLLAVWYAHIQLPVGPGGNMEWSPAWFYALMKQDDVDDNYYEGALIFPNQADGSIEPCEQSGLCSVGMVRVTFNPSSNTSAEVHVNMNSDHGLAGIDDKTFNLTNIASDGDLFGCTEADLPENPHDHYSGFWWHRLPDEQIDNSFIAASWVESFLDTTFIATYDDNGYPVWVSAVNDDRVDDPYNTPDVVPCANTNLTHVHDGLTREVPVRFITKGINPILPAPDSYAVADHRVEIGDFGRIYNDTVEFADQRTMGMYADFDHSIEQRSFSFNIGASSNPEPLEKVANLHSIRYFVPGSEFHDQPQCEITNGVCPLSLDWFTDDDYPEIGLFLYDEDSNDYLRIACAGSGSGCSTSHFPVVLDYSHNISAQGNYHFELWKYSDQVIGTGVPDTNIQGNAMIAESTSFEVVDNLVDGGGGASNITPPDISSSVHSHTSHNAGVGVVAGSAGTSGGAAIYSIPITLPPGRAGMQPSVGLNYNSRSSNSPVGMGWSLAANSAISRCPATVAQDDYTVGITFTDSDRLCLDGQRLIRIDGNEDYWDASGDYRTEIDSFARIRMAGDTSGDQSTNNSLRFEIEYKDGTIAYYGETAAAIAKARGNGDQASTWLLSRQVDRSGNSIHYLYQQQGETTDTGAQAQNVTLGTGETVLSAIAYTGTSSLGNRRVEFTYADRCDGAQCDVYESYVAGYRTEQTVSLSHVKTCVDSSANNACDTGEVIRDYELTHQLSGATGRLLLEIITESACLNGTCEALPATTFTWGDTAQTYSYGKVMVDGQPLIDDEDFNFETWHDNSQDQQPPSIAISSDFDGDGNNDWRVSMDGELYLMGVSAEQQELGRVRLRSIAGDTFVISGLGGGGDFNNDGRTDLMGVMNNPISQQLEYTVLQWKPIMFWDHECTDGSGTTVECMLDDLFNMTFTGVPAEISVTTSTGVSVLGATPHPGDYDGDGSNDILIMTEAGGQDVYRIYYDLDSTSTNFVDIPVPAEVGNIIPAQPGTGDYNGDGRTDILVQGRPNAGISDNLRVSLLGVYFNDSINNGSLQFSYMAASPHGEAGNLNNHLGMDFDPSKTFHLQTDINGDGLADIVFLPPGINGNFSDDDSTHSWHYQINTGQRSHDALYLPAVDTDTSTGLERISIPQIGAGEPGFEPLYAGIMSLMDWNSDGRSELLIPTSIFQSACIIQRNGQNDSGRLYCPADPTLTDWSPNVSNDGCEALLGGTDPQFCETYLGGLGQRDSTVYNMSVLAFNYDAVNEKYSMQVHANTGLKGGRTLTGGDLYGDGIADVFGVHGCFETLNSEVSDPAQQGVTDCSLSFGGSYPLALQALISNNIAGQDPGSDRNYYSNSLQTNETEDTLDLLLAVEDGFDRMTDFSYAPLSASDAANRTVDLPLYTIPDRDSGDSLVDEAAGMEDEYFYFNSSMHVVSSINQPNGLGSGFNTTYYGYEEAVYNTRGRGFQGFRVVHTMTDIPDTNDLWTTTRFHQVFPLSGRVRSAETRTRAEYNNLEAQPINTSAITWSNVNTYTGVYFPQASSETSHSYDLEDRSLINTTTISRGYDNYGNLTSQATESDDAGLMTSTTTIANTYAINSGSVDIWWINQLVNSLSVSDVSYSGNVPGAPNLSKTVTTRYQWDQNQRLPVCVYTIGTDYSLLGSINCDFEQDMTSFVDNATRTITDYDSYGNPDKIYVLGSGMGHARQRLTDTTFGDNGYFVTEITNAEDHTATMTYDPREGNVIQVIDANLLVTKMEYDVFGREIQTWHPIGNVGFNTPLNHYAPRSSMAYQWCMDLTDCTGNELYRMTTTTDGAPVQHQYLDILNRAVRVRSGGFVGNTDTADDWVQASTSYNLRGQMIAQSEPGFSNSGINTTYVYDELGRVASSVNPEASATRYTYYDYDGLTTQIWTGAATAQPGNCTASMPNNDITTGSTICMMRTLATTGWLLQSIDAHGEVTDYWYDGQGNNVVMEDPDNNQMLSTYNNLGQRTAVVDPNQSSSSFTVNGLGEITDQVNARGQVFTMDYDHLGRMVLRTVTDGATTIADSWLYDFSVGQGLLAEAARSVDGIRVWSRAYTYDSVYRPQSMTTDIDGELFTVGTVFDPYFARPYARVYPNDSMSVYTTYDQNGYPVEEGLGSQFDTGEFLHRMDRLSERGQQEQVTYGNGLVQEYDHYNNNGQMQQVWLHPQGGSGENLIHINYNYDHFGNLKQQTQMGGVIEDYTYDHLHRLKVSTRTNVPLAGTIAVSYGYDRLGNMTNKGDFATSYEYDEVQNCGTSPAGPNAVSQASLIDGGGSISYGYDASGNQVCDSDGSQMGYDPYNQPTSISKNGALALFDYSSDGQRYRQDGSIGEVIYIDKMYERHNDMKHQYYVGDYAVVTDEGAGLEISYLHGDRLGSMIAISDASGNINVDEQRGFDPFGKPREGDWDDTDTMGDDLNGYDRTTRGFTGHEHLNATEIIHMNGRTYDYNLGRFMSVDPFIQSPDNSQSMNPYSYIINNPLSGTDPSGYLMEAEEELANQVRNTLAEGGEIRVTDGGRTAVTVTQNNNGSFNAKYDAGLAGGGVTTVMLNSGAATSGSNQTTSSGNGGGVFGDSYSSLGSQAQITAGSGNSLTASNQADGVGLNYDNLNLTLDEYLQAVDDGFWKDAPIFPASTDNKDIDKARERTRKAEAVGTENTESNPGLVEFVNKISKQTARARIGRGLDNGIAEKFLVLGFNDEGQVIVTSAGVNDGNVGTVGVRRSRDSAIVHVHPRRIEQLRPDGADHQAVKRGYHAFVLNARGTRAYEIGRNDGVYQYRNIIGSSTSRWRDLPSNMQD